MSIFSKLRSGYGDLQRAFGGIWLAIVIVVAVCTAFAVAKQETSLMVVCALAIVLLGRLCWTSYHNDDDTTEFGAEFDALQAADRKIVEVRTKAACTERLEIARQEALRYEAQRRAVLGNRAGADV